MKTRPLIIAFLLLLVLPIAAAQERNGSGTPVAPERIVAETQGNIVRSPATADGNGTNASARAVQETLERATAGARTASSAGNHTDATERRTNGSYAENLTTDVQPRRDFARVGSLNATQGICRAGGCAGWTRVTVGFGAGSGVDENGTLAVRRGNANYTARKTVREILSRYVGGNESANVSAEIEDNRLVYKITKKERALLLFLIPVDMEVRITVDADNASRIGEEKPWWAPLASEKGAEPVCGDGVCEKGEGGACSGDCGSLCGNGICELPNHITCAWDCQLSCGDGVCSEGEEEKCPEDCKPGCGNGIGEIGESVMAGNGMDYCPVDYSMIDGLCSWNELNDLYGSPDCETGCGDGLCLGKDEAIAGGGVAGCPYDCGKYACGNGKCEAYESPAICPEDCSRPCGDGKCEKGESPSNCIADCGACNDNVCQKPEFAGGYCPNDCSPILGNGVCEGGESFANSTDCLKCGNCNCGDGVCNGAETMSSCPGDCGKTCGDGVCSEGESVSNCKSDCYKTCGDGICSEEDLESGCEEDCGINCGDGKCSGLETPKICQADCKEPPEEYGWNLYSKDLLGFCGDGKCKGNETVDGCKLDCKAECGDGKCGAGENLDNCPLDCAEGCGNGICGDGESFEACPYDCGYCGDGACNLNKEKYCTNDCGEGLACGDGLCGPGENPAKCPLDCKPAQCGNGECEPTESPQSCSKDCGNVCGDGACDKGETYLSCKYDCGCCGDGFCGFGEDSCKLDCTSACGNSVCEKDETAKNCPYDCAGSWIG